MLNNLCKFEYVNLKNNWWSCFALIDDRINSSDIEQPVKKWIACLKKSLTPLCSKSDDLVWWVLTNDATRTLAHLDYWFQSLGISDSQIVMGWNNFWKSKCLYFYPVLHETFLVEIMSVLQKNVPSPVVYYCAWYVFLRDRRYNAWKGNILQLPVSYLISGSK